MSRYFSSRVTTSPDVLLRIIGDEAVILNLKSELDLTHDFLERAGRRSVPVIVHSGVYDKTWQPAPLRLKRL